MGADLFVCGYENKENSEFKRHLEAVKFCVERGLSYPKETSDFFKGKVEGEDLEAYEGGYVLELLKNGIEVDLPVDDSTEWRQVLKVKDIPESVDTIIVELRA